MVVCVGFSSLALSPQRPPTRRLSVLRPLSLSLPLPALWGATNERPSTAAVAHSTQHGEFSFCVDAKQRKPPDGRKAPTTNAGRMRPRPRAFPVYREHNRDAFWIDDDDDRVSPHLSRSSPRFNADAHTVWGGPPTGQMRSEPFLCVDHQDSAYHQAYRRRLRPSSRHGPRRPPGPGTTPPPSLLSLPRGPQWARGVVLLLLQSPRRVFVGWAQ